MPVGRATLAIVVWAVSVAATPGQSPPFGRVIYHAARVASFGELGVTMIACRHRDPVPRRFAVEFSGPEGQAVSSFGIVRSPPIPAGKKVLFVTDGTFFVGRDDVLNVRLGHLALGTARVISDARIVHCVGKMRMDPGARTSSYRDEIGLVRAGEPLPKLPRTWKAAPYAAPRR
ncbi:MAG: hypothetical protein OZ922_06390 [Myxococcales bacterium]|nr:hypothetical protein [Myxococcales bacterium]